MLVSKFLKQGAKKGETIVGGKENKQRSGIRLRNPLPVYFVMGTLKCLCLG